MQRRQDSALVELKTAALPLTFALAPLIFGIAGLSALSLFVIAGLAALCFLTAALVGTCAIRARSAAEGSRFYCTCAPTPAARTKASNIFTLKNPRFNSGS